MRKVLFLSLLLIAVTGFVAMPASADMVFFAGSVASGQIDPAGTSSGIQLTDLFSDNCVDCLLQNTTLKFGGNSIEIVGGSSSLGILSGTTLFSGTYNGLTVTGCDPIGAPLAGCSVTFDSPVTGTLDAGLLAALGDSGQSVITWTGFAMTSNDDGSNPNSNGILITTAPEPASLMLLGSGFMALVIRRKQAK